MAAVVYDGTLDQPSTGADYGSIPHEGFDLRGEYETKQANDHSLFHLGRISLDSNDIVGCWFRHTGLYVSVVPSSESSSTTTRIGSGFAAIQPSETTFDGSGFSTHP
jgi:hypothetical protein